MTELQARWIQQVEDYYRDTYPRSMQVKIIDILPKSQPALKALFEVIIHSVSAQYRTVPDVAAIEKALHEVADGYPELSQPAPVALLPDNTEGIPLEAIHEYGRHLSEMIMGGDESWRNEGYHEKWLRENGYISQ